MGTDTTCVETTPSTRTSFAYVPGQFAIVSFRSPHISSEPHPFTLSSTPGRNDRLQFTIRASGDWTRQVQNLKLGDPLLIQGPFGRFGHLFTPPNRELIMIAGGIGITPMLSMLRFMADHGDSRPITLIWSNRSRKHVVFGDEMDALAAKLTGLRRIPIFTGEAQTDERSGRLDRKFLDFELSESSRESSIFLCGPPQMMKNVKTDLRKLGFPVHAIYTEAFGF
jgi:predicted ferric reductase